MNATNWQKIKDVFALVLEQPVERRIDFLREACANDFTLREEVESLLEANDEADPLIEKDSYGVATIFNRKGGGYEGREFGRYKIIREIGRGGMGTVFLAERSDGAFQQRVALKIIRQSFADQEIERRFRRERQILASLNHPHIARLLDGGVSEQGEPFLVMEYIEGEPLLDYVENHQLETRERLRLFLKVCHAVSFAHRNLIIHRDIKPSNILVTAEGAPKLLDFGLAKVFDESFALDAMQTATAFRAFTPAYASPEQIRGQNVTTASDIYSLGVVLYELLTGARPFDFEGKNLEQIIKTVSETSPLRPSLIVSRPSFMESDATTDNGQRQSLNRLKTNPQSAIRNPQSLKGDLDNIILMALRKEPERRYKSVEAFDGDIERHLNGLPVTARPQTFSYRASKFIGRNKVAVSAASVVALLLIFGVFAVTWQARVAARERDKARAEQARAEREYERSRKILGFMERVLSYANPAWYAEGNQLRGQARLIDVLNEMGGKIEAEFPGDLDIQAELHHKCAEIFLANQMSESLRAEAHARRALELRRQVFGERHAEVAKDLYYLGAILFTQGNSIENRKLLRQAAAIFREVAPDNANLPYLLDDLGSNESQYFADFDAAEKLLSESLELFRRKDGDVHYNTARLYFGLSLNAARKGDFARADELFREGETRTTNLSNTEAQLILLINRGRLEFAKGNSAAAETILKQVILEARKVKGENSEFEQSARTTLCEIYEHEKDWAKAAELSRTNVEAARKTLPETSVQFGRELAGLSASLLRAGKTKEAKPYFEQAYRILRDNYGDEESLLTFKTDIGECLLLLQRRAEALPLLEEAYAFYNANYPANFRETIRVKELLAQARAKS